MSGQIAANLGRYGLISPFATTGINIALGIEWREENLKYKPDLGSQSGDGAGFGGARQPLKGGFDVPAVFFEAGIPLIQDVPFIQQLIVNGGYRLFLVRRADRYIRRPGRLGYQLRHQSARQLPAGGARPEHPEQFLPSGWAWSLWRPTHVPARVVDGKTAAGRSFEEVCPAAG